MALTRQTMTDEQRKSVALEYLKAFDNGGVTSSGGSILELFANDAQVYFPKWGLADGHDQIGKLFGDVGGTLKSIRHDYANFNWIFSGSDLVVCEGTSHGEHRDGPLARRRARVGRGPLVRRVRDPRLADPALLHLPRPRLRGQGHRALSVASRGTGYTEPSEVDRHEPRRHPAGRRPEDADPPPALHRRPLRRCGVGRDAGHAEPARQHAHRRGRAGRREPTSTRRWPRAEARSRRGAAWPRPIAGASC